MGKTKGKQRQDKYYHLAKEQGYRSRAAFKLLQLDARFRFLPTARAVLDLCAAPGGWVQVAVKHAPVGAFVVGVDLVPIRPIRGAHSLTEDITTSKCRSSVRKLMDSRGVAAFDVVLHDGSPNVGGAWAQEATTQSALVIDAVRLATYFLAPKGAFITKVFRSQDYNAIMFCLKQLFEKVEVTKPQASRGTSAEIYIICLKYKAPAKIEPELLDIKHLFNVENEKKMPRDVLTTKKDKRSREGYEEGVTVLEKVGLASDFIFSEAQTPLEFLGSVTKISFDDPASLPLKNHEITTEEINKLCEDLRVLDKNSFKHILKWRIRLRKALSSSSQVTPKAAVTATESKVIDDDQLLQEMEELTSVIDRKKRQDKKRQSRRKAKDKARKATGMQIDATEEGYGDPDLFSINAIKGGKELKAVESAEFDVEDGSGDSENEATQTHEDSDEEMDSDEEQQRYDAQLEDILDEAYERFMTKRGGEVKQERKRAKRVNTDADADLLEGGEDDGEDVDMDDEGSDEDQDEDEEANPLLLRLDAEKRTKDEIVDQWYSQDVFADAGTGLAEQSDSDDEREKPRKNMKKKIDSGNKEKPAKAQTDLGKKEKPTKAAQRLQQDDIEMVPVEPVRTEDDSDSSSSSDESEPEEDLDDDQKAEVLAYAHKMLRKKQREQILDDAYNRYMFDDEGLPKWFAEDEKRHTQAMKPITKEEVAAMKAQFREIDARPSKKVAEAKARKKRVALKKLEKARQKADIVADQSDINEQSKAKMIDKIYRKAVSTQRPKKEYVVAKKGVQVRTGKGKVLVDPRMKKDKRAEKAGKKKGKGKGGKGGAKGGKGKKGAAGGGQKKGGMRGKAGGKA
ncbi:pre-rRNA 2'-O-ribose RNA methyltransferase [Lolium rigidum]|uniref:pre-rRNA 2'-O-ribose RNA methyltransferase n=1 Tax=Lolium rigidum TaxID=89674 RepID=UPI001F5DDD12|nr:pre-rRNA 2'-O-ribose RNA methyltransferase [Lolium rigidum]